MSDIRRISALLKLFDVDDIRAFDTEYGTARGEHVTPLIAGAKSLVTGQSWFQWYTPGEPRPDFLDFENDRILWVTYSAAAEWSYVLAAGYATLTTLPCNIVDLYAEDCLHVNGRLNILGKKAKTKLIYALRRAGIVDPYEGTKGELSEFIGECKDFSTLTDTKRAEIHVYLMQDVDMHAALFLHWAPEMNAAQVLTRGDFSRVVANYEWHGVKVDTHTVDRIMANRLVIQNSVIAEMEAKHNFGVYEYDPEDGQWHWRDDRFTELVHKRGLQDRWPETSKGSGIYCVADPKRGSENKKVFRNMCQIDDYFEPLRVGSKLADELKSFNLPVGLDGYCRARNASFAQKTMRSSPMGGSIFAMDARNRMLIFMPDGVTGIYSDLSSCEFVVSAVKSGDKAMIRMCDDVRAGRAQNIYLEIMKLAGVAAKDATKKSVGPLYKTWKTGCLAVIYGQETKMLANNLNVPYHTARYIYSFMHDYFPTFWRYINYEIVRSQSRGFIETRGGWRLATRHQKKTTLGNFPIQAEACEILHLGTVKMSDSGVLIATTVHDAVLAFGPTAEVGTEDDPGPVANLIRECWAEAGEEILGYPIATEQYIFTGRFIDDDGMDGWNRLLKLLDDIERK